MAEKDVGALLVVDQQKLVGIFSERDYARKLILKGIFSNDTAVSEMMTRAVLYVEPQSTLDDCMALMTARHIRRWEELEAEGLQMPAITVVKIDMSPAVLASGEQLYDVTCARCHGAEGYDTRMAPALNSQALLG